MGTLLQLLGLALLVAWVGLVFGADWSLLPAGLALMLVSLAVDGVTLSRPRLRRRKQQP